MTRFSSSEQSGAGSGDSACAGSGDSSGQGSGDSSCAGSGDSACAGGGEQYEAAVFGGVGSLGAGSVEAFTAAARSGTSKAKVSDPKSKGDSRSNRASSSERGSVSK